MAACTGGEEKESVTREDDEMGRWEEGGDREGYMAEPDTCG